VKFTKPVVAILRDPRSQHWLLIAYVGAALIVTIQRGVFSFPNDYAIFRASFWNLVTGRDLYVLRLDQARDLFKYSPTFALLFAPFAALPFVAGLFCWNVLNALSLFFALRLLLPRDQAGIAQALVFLPTLRSMQSSQSNALVAALIIVAFVAFERGWLWRGAIAVGLGAVTKIFPLVALAFALPRRDRIRAILISVFVTAALVALPLLVISPRGLLAQYQSWSALEKGESALLGSSLMALFRDVGLGWPAWPIQLIGCAIVLGILIASAGDWGERTVRLQFLGFVMVFCVLFNHRSERQSAVIAISGMVIWYLASPPAVWRTWLFAVVYLLVAISGANIIPDAAKHILIHQVRFPIPLTIVWLAMLGDLTWARSTGRRFTEAG
jgi:Glycosyltransferase family 87